MLSVNTDRENFKLEINSIWGEKHYLSNQKLANKTYKMTSADLIILIIRAKKFKRNHHNHSCNRELLSNYDLITKKSNLSNTFYPLPEKIIDETGPIV